MEYDIDFFNFPSGICDNLPELQTARMQKTLAEDRIHAVKAGYIPTISMSGYAGVLGYQNKFSHFFHTRESSQNWFGNCFIGLNISIPIFDANSKKLKIRQHRHETEEAENRSRLLHDRMHQEYSNAMLQINHNIEVYRTQSHSYQQALDVYKITEEQYREGCFHDSHTSGRDTTPDSPDIMHTGPLPVQSGTSRPSAAFRESLTFNRII